MLAHMYQETHIQANVMTVLSVIEKRKNPHKPNAHKIEEGINK